MKENKTDTAAPIGLSAAEAAQRMERGEGNRMQHTTGTTVRQILRSNLLTYFNLIFLIITILLCLVGSFRNLTFLPIVLGNLLIGIIQELRAKHTLDKMSLLHAPHATALRDGVPCRLPAQDLVKDDVVLLQAGDAICADAILLQGCLSVNESLLTGEADEIVKHPGDTLLSGSFVVFGTGYARLERVAEACYLAQLTAKAKAMPSGEQSEMIRSINRIIKWVGLAVIPIGIILFCQGYFINHETIQKSITSMVAAVLGMIPEGLYLLTIVALALGTIRLARRHVLLHDMKSIETLARIDVLCVDKTGTITAPQMQLTSVVLCPNAPLDEPTIHALLRDYAAAVPDNNATMQALRDWIATLTTPKAPPQTPLQVQPFSAASKYGAVQFAQARCLFGAPEVLLGESNPAMTSWIASYTVKGLRAVLFAASPAETASASEPMPIPLALLLFSNPIRENAAQTFRYFREQGVSIKVISGDHPQTVAQIAQQADIENASVAIDARLLDTDEKIEAAALHYTVFGRVSPEQKQKLVLALQKAGHTVAMTGDGINDILAMKDADCSVAMASGSEAAAQVAQVVLLDNDFGKMPHIVTQGRQIVNNLQRSASLFLVKNIFSILMALFSAIFLFTYPLEPAQISLISAFTIGLPGFLLTLEPNNTRITGSFMKTVLLRAFPAGLTDCLAVAALVVCADVFSLPDADIATVCTMLLSAVGLMILYKIARPLTRIKAAILGACTVGLLVCGVFFNQLFAISGMSAICVLLLIVFSFAAESLLRYLTLVTDYLAGIRKRLAARRAKKHSM